MGVSGHTVRLGISAPEGVSIYREEIWLAVKEENRAAAAADPGVAADGAARGRRRRARRRAAVRRARRGAQDTPRAPERRLAPTYEL